MTGKRLDDVALPLDTSGFDLDAWLDEARPPERSVTVYGRGDLAAEYEQLAEELRDVREAVLSESGMMNSPAKAREREIAERMTVVRDELLASKRVIRVRALDKDTQAEIVAGAANVSDEERANWRAEAYVTAACVSPRMTSEQVRRLRAKIGEGQFLALFEAAWDVSNDKTVQVPFSSAHSAALITPAT